MGVDLLEEAGFDVLQASNADEALRVLEVHPEVRVVFSDVEMPGGSTDRPSRGVFASAGPKSGSF
jgi:two-component system, response regulator PdtaR